MKFYIDEKEEYSLNEIIQELANQYADDNQELGLDEWDKRIKPNLELLLICVEEIKDDRNISL